MSVTSGSQPPSIVVVSGKRILPGAGGATRSACLDPAGSCGPCGARTGSAPLTRPRAADATRDDAPTVAAALDAERLGAAAGGAFALFESSVESSVENSIESSVENSAGSSVDGSVPTTPDVTGRPPAPPRRRGRLASTRPLARREPPFGTAAPARRHGPRSHSRPHEGSRA
jgi:hypothetical protein